MKRVYRFSADLRSRSQEEPKSPREERTVDDEVRRSAALEAALARIGPAVLNPSEFEDPLDAQELLQAYNGSLRRSQNLPCGRYEQNGIDHHVFYDEWENKHIITQQVAARGQRISELIADLGGGLLRFSFERVAGPVMDLENLMLTGVADLQDAYFRTSPGYWLMTTRYYREGERLSRVEQAQQHWSPQLNDFERVEDVILG